MAADCDRTVELPVATPEATDAWGLAAAMLTYKQDYSMTRARGKMKAIGRDAFDMTTWSSARERNPPLTRKTCWGRRKSMLSSRGWLWNLGELLTVDYVILLGEVMIMSRGNGAVHRSTNRTIYGNRFRLPKHVAPSSWDVGLELSPCVVIKRSTGLSVKMAINMVSDSCFVTLEYLTDRTPGDPRFILGSQAALALICAITTLRSLRPKSTTSGGPFLVPRFLPDRLQIRIQTDLSGRCRLSGAVLIRFREPPTRKRRGSRPGNVPPEDGLHPPDAPVGETHLDPPRVIPAREYVAHHPALRATSWLVGLEDDGDAGARGDLVGCGNVKGSRFCATHDFSRPPYCFFFSFSGGELWALLRRLLVVQRRCVVLSKL